MPSEVRYSEVKRLLESHGWVLNRINGSHHVFTKPAGRSFSIPVHHGKVKFPYVREIKKHLGIQ